MENKELAREPPESKLATKRLLTDDSGTATKIPKTEENEAPKKKKQKFSQEKKSPVMALHELKPNLKYEFSESGPPHSKVFTASLTLNDQTYSATGLTKKIAKANVAEIVLQCCIQLKNPASIFSNSSAVHSKADFSQDPVDIMDESDTFYTAEVEITKSQSKQLPVQLNPKTSSSTPMYILNRLRPGLKYEIIKEEGKSHEKTFTIQVIVDGRVFEGTGSSKKLAKNAAAYEALKINFLTHVPDVIPPPATAVSKAKEESIEFGDYISRLIESTYQSIMKDHQETFSRYKVLAGIVMTQGTDGQGGVVICITSGSKCISGGNLSIEGETLNDCHAEILARRCLVEFLYDQLQAYKRNQHGSIFEAGSSGRLRLKPNILFHLYVSSSPCGDARIFTLTDKSLTIGASKDPHPHRLGRGVLRTKIESGEGTVPVVTTIQTWDGIIQGERLLTMSCSDKVARWNVVGLQGSILSHIIEPIYLNTLVIGSLFHRVHIQRAIIGRIEHLQGLPAPFRLTRPSLVTTSTPPDRLPTKSPRYSVCWTVGWTEVEIVDASKGRLVDGSISRLSKRRLFERFIRLMSLDPVWRTRIDGCIHNDFVSYGAIKAGAKDFVEAREKLELAFTTAKLGHWIKKPLEQNCFELHVLPTTDPDSSIYDEVMEESNEVRDSKPLGNF